MPFSEVAGWEADMYVGVGEGDRILRFLWNIRDDSSIGEKSGF